MTELVTIEHAGNGCAVFVYGTPYAKKTLLPHVHRVDRFFYLTGALEPNFPLPAIPYAVIWPWQWHAEIDATNTGYVTIIRVTKVKANEYVEGSFAAEYRI